MHQRLNANLCVMSKGLRWTFVLGRICGRIFGFFKLLSHKASRVLSMLLLNISLPSFVLFPKRVIQKIEKLSRRFIFCVIFTFVKVFGRNATRKDFEKIAGSRLCHDHWEMSSKTCAEKNLVAKMEKNCSRYGSIVHPLGNVNLAKKTLFVNSVRLLK